MQANQNCRFFMFGGKRWRLDALYSHLVVCPCAPAPGRSGRCRSERNMDSSFYWDRYSGGGIHGVASPRYDPRGIPTFFLSDKEVNFASFLFFTTGQFWFFGPNLYTLSVIVKDQILKHGYPVGLYSTICNETKWGKTKEELCSWSMQQDFKPS